MAVRHGGSSPLGWVALPSHRASISTLDATHLLEHLGPLLAAESLLHIELLVEAGSVVKLQRRACGKVRANLSERGPQTRTTRACELAK